MIQLAQSIQQSEIESLQRSTVNGYLDSMLGMFGHDPDPERAAARKHLIDFMVYEGRGRWIHEPYLEILCEKLEQVADGSLRRLMVFMPPRHGKSEICSKKFPAWYLSHYPDEKIIISSYSADLAYDFSRIARETLKSERELFPNVTVNPSVRAVKMWGIDNYHGGLIATGVEGPIAGRGATIGLIDDPFKNYKEAESEIVRESVWQWYKSTFRTRQQPGGRIVLIMTRWHEDDLAGRLCAAMDAGTGEQWEIIDFPAMAEDDDILGRKPGEALSSRFPLEELNPIKLTLGPYLWGALYQQHPRPEEGNYFKTNWFIEIDNLKELLSKWKQAGEFIPVYAAMDTAIAEGEQNDWNVIPVGIISPEGERILVDVNRFRGDSYEIATAIIETQKMWKPLLFGFEDGMILKAVWPYVKTLMKQEKVAINSEFLTPIKDKIARARMLQGQMRQGQWLFPVNTTWYEEYKERMLGFPNVKFDDEIDAHAWLAITMSGVDSLLDPTDLNQCAA